MTQCAWCSPTLDPTASHGVCARCAGEVEARTWTPREHTAQELMDVLVDRLGLGVDMTCRLPAWCGLLMARSWSKGSGGEMTPADALRWLSDEGMVFE